MIIIITLVMMMMIIFAFCKYFISNILPAKKLTNRVTTNINYILK